MSYMLQHLHNGYQVDQAILSEEDRIVVSDFNSNATEELLPFGRNLKFSLPPFNSAIRTSTIHLTWPFERKI